MFSLKISGVTYPGLLFLLMGPSFCHPYQYTRVHQKFAARMVTRNWKGIYSDLLARLHWPTLSIRRRRQKAALCYRIISNHSIIPSSLFTPHPSPKLRHKHSIPLYYPQVRSTSHLSSFGVPIWNCLPPDVVTAPSSDSFKGSLKLLPIL